MTNFTDLGLAAPILKALEKQGYVTPTPIQAQAIPAVMSGRDLLGIAQTGTGKTAAFSLPIINRLARNTVPRQPKTCRALILSPTRELATQIADNVRAYSEGSALTVTTVFGGVGIRPQTQALLRGVDILVATPGRLLDHMTERNITFAATEVFVLDEADQMLDLGFMPAIRRIVGQLPKVRQNLFFSATMPTDIGKLASDLLKDPVRVAVTPVATTVERVEQRVILIETHKKKALLAELFSNPEISRALVFTRTKRGADRVARHLEAAGVGVAVDLEQFVVVGCHRCGGSAFAQPVPEPLANLLSLQQARIRFGQAGARSVTSMLRASIRSGAWNVKSSWPLALASAQRLGVSSPFISSLKFGFISPRTSNAPAN